MLTDRPSYSVAASGAIVNVLAGRPAEWLGRASILDLYGAAFLAGANDAVSLTYTVGGDSKVLIPAGSSLNVNAAGPQLSFDQLLDSHSLPMGAHLILGVVADATVGTHNGRFMMVVKP